MSWGYRRRRYQAQERIPPPLGFSDKWEIVLGEGASCPVDLRSNPRKTLDSGPNHRWEGVPMIYAIEGSDGNVYVMEAGVIGGWEYNPARRKESK